VTPAARAVHKAILRSFATTGRAPDRATLAEVAPGGREPEVLLRELHDRDVVRFDEQGRIHAAYPFSAVPTAHRVTIADGPTVFAMCAIDALGIADMLGKDVTITSTDPATGEPIGLTVHGGQATWEPETAVVFVGAVIPTAPTGDGAAVDRCCQVMNFFVSTDSAQAWIAAHSGVSGVALTQSQAFRLGIDIFAPLLND
jgi:Alkylmercury lyase